MNYQPMIEVFEENQIAQEVQMSIYPVRASSWAALFDCAYKWEGVHLEGIRKPGGVRALLGTGIHAGTAAYDQGQIEHGSVGIEDSVDVMLETLRAPGFEVDYAADDLTLLAAEKTGISLLMKYCREVSPLYKFSAVEMETKPLDIDCGGGITVRLTGTMDRSRVIHTTAKKRIVDLKSGGAAVQKGQANTKGFAPQDGTYCLLTEYTTGETVDDTSEIIGLKTRGKPEIATGEIQGAKQLMTGTDEYPGLIEIAAQMFRTGLFPPNPSSILCNKKYCARWATCPYHR